MNLLIFVIVAVVVVAFIAIRFRTPKYASEFLEKISLFEFLLNKGKLHWLYSRVKSSKSRFIQLSLPGQTAIILKDADDVKVILTILNYSLKPLSSKI